MTAQADGLLRIFPLPSPLNGAGCGGARPALDASCPVPGGDVYKWAPRVASVRAHKGGLTGATSLVSARLSHRMLCCLAGLAAVSVC